MIKRIQNQKRGKGKNFPQKSLVLNWIGMNFERFSTPRTRHRHSSLVEIYSPGAYSFDKSRFFNGHSLDSKRNSLLSHLSKLHDIIRTFTNGQPLNLDEKYSRVKLGWWQESWNAWKPEVLRKRAWRELNPRTKYCNDKANELVVSHLLELHENACSNGYDITGCRLFNVHLNTSFPVAITVDSKLILVSQS